MSNSGVLDTRFRPSIDRMVAQGRLDAYTAPIDPHLAVAAVLKKRDGGPAVLFTAVDGYAVPVIGNVLCCQQNCEAAFGVGFRSIRDAISRAFSAPIAPVPVTNAAAQQNVHTDKIDLARMLPVLFHTPEDAGRFITAGVVIVRDPETGVYNASYHRLQLIGPNRTAIKLDYGRHLRLAFERAKRMGVPLPIVVCIGTDLALQFTAATMGSQMPEHADELAAAGGFCGRALPVAKAMTQDLLVPADTEIVLEGRILPDQTIEEGPFGEFVGYLSPAGDAPIFEVTAVTHRNNPVYQVINGYSFETTMLRKYVLEASLLKTLQAAVPIVIDAEMTAGGLHRFHAVLQVRKSTAQHDGLQRNAILAAFGALKDLDMIIAVDEDIDIRDPRDVEYALATRMEASRDLFIIPATRGHEYIRVSQNGIRAKVGIDATVPFEEKARFRRCEFVDVTVDAGAISSDPDVIRKYLSQ
ncbi:MAG: 2,5-furandicarboxylate decarboxylase 1 [Alphaproteobacteria bacterium]|jgi:2,5-furandicarboxylate decarboxylase 1|nr:2,5-furandicarboxylate decarboxylase 1 [Alphaproteobacteria bacterium]